MRTRLAWLLVSLCVAGAPAGCGGGGTDPSGGDALVTDAATPADVPMDTGAPADLAEIAAPLDAGPDGADPPPADVPIVSDTGDDTGAEDVPADTDDVFTWGCTSDAECIWLARSNTEPCLFPACDPVSGACVLAPRPDGDPCDNHELCTDGDACLDGRCESGGPRDCDDGDRCTTDTCTSAAGCVYTAIADCCVADADCDDGNPCTDDRCPGEGMFCKHRRVEGCCAGPEDCDDGDSCTQDLCTAEGCEWTPICCTDNDECDDGLDCTEDRCLDGLCVGVVDALSECCEPEVWAASFDGLDPAGFTFTGGVGEVAWHVVADGPGESAPLLYYGDPARRSYDTGGSSTGTALSPVFVLPDRAAASLQFRVIMNTESYFEKLYVDLHVPFGSVRLYTNSNGGHAWETADVDLSGAAGLPAQFAFVFSADSSVFDEGVYIDDVALVSTCALHDCSTWPECDDGNNCTEESCEGAEGWCAFTWSPGCCSADADCDDGNPCTRDRCSANLCSFTPTGDPTCCVADADCGTADPCVSAACVDHRCEVTYDTAVCPLAVPYAQSFDEAITFDAVAWETVNEAGGSETNWVLRTADGIFPTRFARFDWSPSATNFDHCLRSPALALGLAQRAVVSFDTRFSSFTGSDADNQLDFRWSTDAWASSNVLWSWHESEGDIERVRTELPLELPPLANQLWVAFCLSGISSFEINNWDVDDLRITVGEPPSWVSEPFELTAYAGELTAVELLAQDPDDDPLRFTLGADAPAWATLVPVSDALVRLELIPPEGDVGRHTFELFVDDGGPTVGISVTVNVALAGEEILLEEDFTEGSFAERGWTVSSDAGSPTNDWTLTIGDPFASRHARFSGQPPVASFNDALASPAIPTDGYTAFRVRWSNELLPAGGVRNDEWLSVALQVARDAGLWETVWTHTTLDGVLPAGPVTVDLGSGLADTTTFQIRFRVRGSDSTLLHRWVVDDLRVFGR